MLALPPVRRAACAVTSGAARATGWVVSTKGLIATSHSAIGYLSQSVRSWTAIVTSNR